MKKIILVPTDFTVQSLLPVEYAALHNPADELDIILVHCAALSNSISELLFYSPEEEINKYMNDAFANACHNLKNRFGSKIGSLRVELFHGFTTGAFENFIAAKKIQEILIPAGYRFVLHKTAVDPLRFIKSCSLPVSEVSLQIKNNPSQKDQAAA